MTPETLKGLNSGGYKYCRQLPSGDWAGIHLFLGTISICVGLDEIELLRRYKYKKLEDAMEALKTWNGQGEPPGYIKAVPWRCRLLGHKYAASEGLGLIGGVQCVRATCGHRPSGKKTQ